LWQYYVIDSAREKETVKASLSSGKVEAWKGPDVKDKPVADLANIFRGIGKIKGLAEYASRFGVQVEGPVAAGFVKAAFAELDDADALSTAWQKVVDVLNVDLYKEWEDDTKAAVDGVKNRLKYIRLDAHGPRLGEITKQYVDDSFLL
jgi:glycogen debranching enzyme